MASDRYKAMGSEASWQPGSSDSVLRNKAGITSSTEMNDAELALLLQLYEYLMDDAFPERGLRISDLMEWHRLWLGNLYDWAGQERRVNLAKGDFHFAAAAQIPRLLTPTTRTSCNALRHALTWTPRPFPRPSRRAMSN